MKYPKIAFLDNDYYLKIQVKTKKGILDIIKGTGAYSDTNTWEIGLLDKKGGRLIYNRLTSNNKTDKVRGYISNLELTEIIKKLNK